MGNLLGGLKNMKKIKLTKGKYAIVDAEDYPLLSRHKWQYKTDGRGGVTHATWNRAQSPFQMQDWIISKRPWNKIMFKNRNPLDCRKCNLVEVGRGNPTHYSYKRKGNYTSKYKGVCWTKKDKSWICQVNYEGTKFSKYCKSEKEAALLYNKKAKELYGEFAYQNKVT